VALLNYSLSHAIKSRGSRGEIAYGKQNRIIFNS